MRGDTKAGDERPITIFGGQLRGRSSDMVLPEWFKKAAYDAHAMNKIITEPRGPAMRKISRNKAYKVNDALEFWRRQRLSLKQPTRSPSVETREMHR